jgi:hypothetical protein
LPTPGFETILEIVDVYTLFPDGIWSRPVWQRVWQTVPLDVEGIEFHVIDEDSDPPPCSYNGVDVAIYISKSNYNVTAMIVDSDRRTEKDKATPVYIIGTHDDSDSVERLAQRLERNTPHSRHRLVSSG